MVHVVHQVVTPQIEGEQNDHKEPGQLSGIEEFDNGITTETAHVFAEIKRFAEFVVFPENLFGDMVGQSGLLFGLTKDSGFDAGLFQNATFVFLGVVDFEFLLGTAERGHEDDGMQDENKSHKEDPHVCKLEDQVFMERNVDEFVDQQQNEGDETHNGQLFEDL